MLYRLSYEGLYLRGYALTGNSSNQSATVARWAVKDSNLRRLLPTDLQSVPVGHLGNRPRYIEPFVRSSAVASSRPRSFDGISPTTLIANYQRKPTMGIEPITYHLQGGCSAD